MPIQISCPACQAALRAKDELAGKQLRCPKCGGAIRVPPLGGPSAKPPPASPADRGLPTPPSSSATAQVKFACPQCQRVMQAPAGLVGKKARCQNCRQVLTIPAPAASGPRPPASAAPGPVPPPVPGGASPPPKVPPLPPVAKFSDDEFRVGPVTTDLDRDPLFDAAVPTSGVTLQKRPAPAAPPPKKKARRRFELPSIRFEIGEIGGGLGVILGFGLLVLRIWLRSQRQAARLERNHADDPPAAQATADAPPWGDAERQE